MKIQDFEVFKFSENIYTPFKNNGKDYLLNKSPYLDIVLTDYCNADCNFCIADLIHDKLKCDLEKFQEKVLFAIEHMNVREVLLLGGEPTMSANLIPMIEWLRMQDLDKIIMTTNGIRLAKDALFREKVMEAGLTHINISLMSVDPEKQALASNTKKYLGYSGVRDIYKSARLNNVSVRINTNVYFNNNDTVDEITKFYSKVKPFCDSVKFSPLFNVDAFSVLNVKTTWVLDNILPDIVVENLFRNVEQLYARGHDLAIIENDLQFGFVKNTMIPLNVPIIMNWNFGRYTGMMEKVTKESKINNLKLLPNNELSLSWNREDSKYFIKT